MKHFANLGNLNMKHCAFCKYWYDPTNSVITPAKGRKGVWEYDGEEKRCCLKWNNSQRKAFNICKFFECKLGEQ